MPPCAVVHVVFQYRVECSIINRQAIRCFQKVQCSTCLFFTKMKCTAKHLVDHQILLKKYKQRHKMRNFRKKKLLVFCGPDYISAFQGKNFSTLEICSKSFILANARKPFVCNSPSVAVREFAISGAITFSLNCCTRSASCMMAIFSMCAR